MSMQEPANHYRLGLKLGTYCDNAAGPVFSQGQKPLLCPFACDTLQNNTDITQTDTHFYVITTYFTLLLYSLFFFFFSNRMFCYVESVFFCLQIFLI